MASEGLVEGDPSSSTIPSRTAPNGVLTRIRRTLSTKNYFTSKSLKPSRSSSQPGIPTILDESSPAITLVIHDEPSDLPATPTGYNLTPFEKFVKSLKRKRDGKAPSEFPPSHWEVIEEQRVVVEDSEESKDDPGISLPDDTPAEPEATLCSEESVPSDGSQTPSEPATLAQRIQTMLSSFPPFFATSPPIPTSGDPSNSASPSFVGETQRIPIPLFLSDSKLVSLLSSSSVMNGSADKDRPSVWSILDHLKAKVPGLTPPEENNGSNSKQKDAEILSPSSRRTDDDNSSVMLYAPLVPDDASEVEIARSEMLVELEPVSGTEQLKNSSPSEEHPAPKRIWVPSSTKLSIQLNWWGYRLYLPPPVLAVLDNKRLESAKRAAIITTALKWALDHISGLMIPPQMHPVLTVLKSLIPYLGYVGGFVAWSWGAIKTFDKGNGVVLTATWLLPVALIPGTWEDDDYPEVVELQRGVSDSTTTPQS